MDQVVAFRLELPVGLHGQNSAGQVARLRVDRQRIAVHRLFLDLVYIILKACRERQDQRDPDNADGSREGCQKRPPLLGHKVVQAQSERRRQGHGGLAEILVDSLRLLFNIKRIGVVCDPAVFEPHDPVRVLPGQFRVVGDHDDETVVRHFLEKIHDLHGSFGVERARRLVREKDLGIIDKSSRDGDALHLAAGHLVGLFVGLVFKPDLVERIEGHLPALIAGYAADRERQFDVLKDRLVLKDKADSVVAVGVPVAVPVFFGRYAVDDQVAAVIAVQSADNIEKCGLARSAWTENGYKLIIPQVEGNIIERGLLKTAGDVFLVDILKLEHSKSSFRNSHSGAMNK